MKSFKKKILSTLVAGSLLSALFLATACGEEEPVPTPSENPTCTSHSDADNDSVCDVCGAELDAPCTEHADSDGDGECDTCGAEVETSCDEHSDSDGDGKCDSCGEQLPEEGAEKITFTVSISDEDGNAVTGIKLILKDGEGTTAAELVSDAEGKMSAELVPGTYTLELPELPEGLSVDENGTELEIGADTSEITLTAKDNRPNGSAERPYLISDEAFIGTIGAGETVHFYMKAVDMLISVEAPEATLTCNGKTYATEDGKISVPVKQSGFYSTTPFTVTSTAAESTEIKVEVVAIPGTFGAPFDLTLGETTAVVSKGGAVYYTYTASTAGTFTLTTMTMDNGICITNLKNSYTTDFTSGTPTTAEPDTLSLTLSAGDTIRIEVTFIVDNGRQTNNVVFETTFTES